mgnify:CR=1 FL=1
MIVYIVYIKQSEEIKGLISIAYECYLKEGSSHIFRGCNFTQRRIRLESDSIFLTQQKKLIFPFIMPKRQAFK